MSPTIRITGPPEKLIHPPTGMRGGSFKSEPTHIWLSPGPIGARKVLAHSPVTVTEEEQAVLDDAGVSYTVIE